MAEAVRPKKPKPRERVAPPLPERSISGDSTTARIPAPLIPPRPPSLLSRALPDVPTHSPASISSSREPTPQLLQPEVNGLESRVIASEPPYPGASEVNAPMPNATAETTSYQEDDDVREKQPLQESEAQREKEQTPIGNLIFPRATSIVAENAISDLSSPVQATPRSLNPSLLPCYPTVPQLSDDLISAYGTIARPPTYDEAMSSTTTSIDSKQSRTKVSVDAPPMYPALDSVFEKNEFGLLSEDALLSFYKNSFYERAEDMLDDFIRSEEVPDGGGPLFALLSRLKELSEHMRLNEVSETENREALKKCLHECWTFKQQTAEFKGVCLENKACVGVAKFNSAIANQGKMDQMKSLLKVNCSLLLEGIIAEESLFRSLALQIQWLIIDLNTHFMLDHGLTLQSPPQLLDSSSVAPFPSRLSLLRALSDIFYHLRFPNLSKRYIDALVNWATELICVLNMSCRVVDGVQVLCHLLRLPSPISEWAPPFVQTFIQAASPPKVKVDYSLALLYHIMNPIKARDAFLRHIAYSENEETTWAILGSDEEETEFSFVTITEADLVALLLQLPLTEVYTIAFLHFSSAYPDKKYQFIAMTAFQLLLMKVLDNGLTAYTPRPGYKQFCRTIASAIKESVRELCEIWNTSKGLLARGEEEQLQPEVDRILLLALIYILNRPACGLWQFGVDLPYDCVSEECRLRCEFLLRAPEKYGIHELYDIPLDEIRKRIEISDLKVRIAALDQTDGVFLVNALSMIVSNSSTEASRLIRQIIDICFCDEAYRENFYKVGSEAIAQLMEKRPACLEMLISVLDRQMAHMDNYAVDVLSTCSLSPCRISTPILSVLGKWLITNAPDKAPNKLARRILASLHWGLRPDSETELWMDPSVHLVCAETIVKAHSVHCNKSNGMISKSLKNIAKLAGKISDSEQLFTQFCWDLLIKLKLPDKGRSPDVSNDLATYFVDLSMHYLESASVFLEKGLPLLSELINSGASTASVVILSKLLARNYKDVEALGDNAKFVEVFEQILYVDQLPYAVQWLSGPSSSPTPLVRLLCSSISFHSRQVHNLANYLRAWVDLLCARRTLTWNSDQVSLQVLGTIVRIAFLRDPVDLLGLREQMTGIYTEMQRQTADSSKGLMSWFSSDKGPPPLLPSSHFSVSFWASWLLLSVESQSFSVFYQHVFEALFKKDKATVDQAVKKAATKSSTNLPIDRMAIYRWAELTVKAKDDVTLPLILQQLAIEAYKLRNVNGNKLCYSRRLLDTPTMSGTMNALRKALQEAPDNQGLTKAVSGWLFCQHEVTRKGFDFSVFDLDYLLQQVLAGETAPWTNLLSMSAIGNADFEEQRLYALTCHLHRKAPSRPQTATSPRSSHSAARPLPRLPNHPGLPPAPIVDPSVIFQQNALQTIASPFVKQIHSLANEFLSGSDKLEECDSAYCDILLNLYASTTQAVPIHFACSMRCPNPKDTTVSVQAYVFNKTADAQLTVNREKRSAIWADLNASVVDKTAVATASLEHVARLVSRIASSASPSHRIAIQVSGRSLFYLLTDSVGEFELLFPPASDTYSNSLRTLANGFIKNRPEEQFTIMRKVLDGFVLSDPLIEAFTPEVLSPNDLYNAYTQLSEAVRKPEKSQRALQLLARLGVEKAALSLHASQFSALLPVAFTNLTSQADPSSPLHILCHQHYLFFAFHQFPSNFSKALELALEGCNSSLTPVTLLDTFVERLGIRETFEPRISEYQLHPNMAAEFVNLLSSQLTKSKQKLPVMYSVWYRYLDPVSRMAQYFLYFPISQYFDPSQPISVIQKDLLENFARIVSVFGPLLVPVSPSQPPFGPSHEQSALLVLDRFVELLNSLPHNASIPATGQTVPSLVFKFFYDYLSYVNNGAQHYYATLTRELMRIKLNHFSPSLRALEAMNECLEKRSSAIAPFIAQMIVRIPWPVVLSTGVPDELKPKYLFVLLACLVRIASKEANYHAVRASFVDLLKQFDQRNDWNQIEADDAESLAGIVANLLPSESLSSPNDALTVLLIIWRKTCCISPKEPFTQSTLQKQAAWVRAECRLVLRGGPSHAPISYNSLISDVQAIAREHQNLRAFAVVEKELTAFWTTITDAKFGESMVSCWKEYMAQNPESPLLVLSLHTLISSLNEDQLSTGIRVLEATLLAYFTRLTCSWAEVVQWIQFPPQLHIRIRDYLLSLPSSENKLEPQMLCTKALLDFSPQDENYLKLHNYIINLKAKYVWCEPALVLVFSRLLSWLYRRLTSLPSAAPFTVQDDLLHPITRWLNRAAKDESSFISSLLSAKKTSHSSKLRCFFGIMELYLQQQSLGEGRRPRLAENLPVLQSRIQSLKELAAQKSNQPFSTAFNASTAYFSQVDIHHLGSASSLALAVGKTLFKDKYLTDV